MRTVYSYYVADILHRGHRLFMKNAKKFAGEDGISIVGILTKEAVLEKKKKKPILSFDERMSMVQELEYTDVVVPQTEYSPAENIKKFKPDIVLESESHKKDEIDNIVKLVESYGGRVFIMPYYPYTCSTDIKKKIRRQ